MIEAGPLEPVKIMLIGDSITEGVCPSGSYRRYLDGMLRRDGKLPKPKKLGNRNVTPEDEADKAIRRLTGL